MNQLETLLNAELDAHNDLAAQPQASHEEHLPFTLRVVRSEDDLLKAVGIRHAAYARHVPGLAQTLTQPEATDFENGVAVLLAESKLNGMALGTMRIQTNQFKPISIEQSLTLPTWLRGGVLAEATRLGITEERIGRVVKTALFKAYYEYCVQAGVDWMVIAGRSPIDRQYERLLFEDVYPGQGFIPLKHAGNLPHRVMALRVAEVEPKWRAAQHPLYSYFFHTQHPDIIPTPVQPYEAMSHHPVSARSFAAQAVAM